VQERQVTCRFGAADPGRSFAPGNAPAKLLPWIGRYLEYREFGGFRVLPYEEVSLLPEGEFSYARFRVTGQSRPRHTDLLPL
jgi:hypothetical protein